MDPRHLPGAGRPGRWRRHGRGRGDGALVGLIGVILIFLVELLQAVVELLPGQELLVQIQRVLGGVVADQGVPHVDLLPFGDVDLQGRPVPVPVEDQALAGGDAAAEIRLVGGVFQEPVPGGLDLAGLAQGVAAVAVDAPRHQARDDEEDQQGLEQRFHRPASSLRYPS